MKKAVIFDMYETLVTLWHSEPYMGHEISADAGIEEGKFREIWDTTDDERACGFLNFEEVIERILRVNGRYSEELCEELIRKRKESKVDAFNHLHSDIIPMLESLKNEGIKLGLITNCFNEEKEAIINSDIYKYFDVVCMSCELGMKKPDRRIFEMCISKLEVNPEDCLYCGDGGSRELEAAKEMNMSPVQALWYLKPGVGQPVGRLEGFPGAENPLNIVSMACE